MKRNFARGWLLSKNMLLKPKPNSKPKPPPKLNGKRPIKRKSKNIRKKFSPSPLPIFLKNNVGITDPLANGEIGNAVAQYFMAEAGIAAAYMQLKRDKKDLADLIGSLSDDT